MNQEKGNKKSVVITLMGDKTRLNNYCFRKIFIRNTQTDELTENEKEERE